MEQKSGQDSVDIRDLKCISCSPLKYLRTMTEKEDGNPLDLISPLVNYGTDFFASCRTSGFPVFPLVCDSEGSTTLCVGCQNKYLVNPPAKQRGRVKRDIQE